MNTTTKALELINETEHPFKNEILEIRKIILNSDDRVQEVIKWSAPTYDFEGPIATFNLRSKKFVNLTFHKGALIDDPHNVLEGEAKEARVMRFRDMADVKAKEEALTTVIRNWIKMKQ